MACLTMTFDVLIMEAKIVIVISDVTSIRTEYFTVFAISILSVVVLRTMLRTELVR